MDSTGKMLIAFAVGAAVGATLGVLFAPDKGTETRKKLQDTGKKMADKLQEKFKEGNQQPDAKEHKEYKEEYI